LRCRTRNKLLGIRNRRGHHCQQCSDTCFVKTCLIAPGLLNYQRHRSGIANRAGSIQGAENELNKSIVHSRTRAHQHANPSPSNSSPFPFLFGVEMCQKEWQVLKDSRTSGSVNLAEYIRLDCDDSGEMNGAFLAVSSDSSSAR